MEFVLYKNEIHVFVSQIDHIATIAGLKMIGTGDCFYSYEIDVDASTLEVSPIVHQKSMIYRLKEYLDSHDDIFGFVEHELSMIHYF